MAYEQRDNSGSLFVNDRKEKDQHPDRTGSAVIDGKAYWVSGWIKQSNGKKFLSLAFKPKEEQRAEPDRGGSTTRQSKGEFYDDSVPF